ncbi:MAG: TIGR02206 family membrane protein [Erysipelotrichaceae bacterium]|nr:TIGR02206 family membrane protein [Erysipelotrichaceae bacterium]
MFDNFWKVEENIESGLGFALFSLPHLIELALCAAFAVFMSIRYRKADGKGRDRIRKAIAVALIIDELFKHAGLLATDSWLPKYLPLHLCSINIFIVVIHAFMKKKSNLLANFLYAVSLPSALIAIITPNWQFLPVLNFMHLHSYTVHVLLVAYPLILMAAKEVKRDYRLIPFILLILVILAIPLHFFNIGFGTNFLFIESPPAGTPLVLFKQWFGNHVIGYAIFLPLVLLLMYIPFKKPEKR